MSASTTPYEPCWFDDVGSRWEREGVDPGCIFEFHFRLSDNALPGGMVETAHDNTTAFAPQDIRRVVVRLTTGEEVTMPWKRPLVLVNLGRIVAEMC